MPRRVYPTMDGSYVLQGLADISAQLLMSFMWPPIERMCAASIADRLKQVQLCSLKCAAMQASLLIEDYIQTLSIGVYLAEGSSEGPGGRWLSRGPSSANRPHAVSNTRNKPWP